MSPSWPALSSCAASFSVSVHPLHGTRTRPPSEISCALAHITCTFSNRVKTRRPCAPGDALAHPWLPALCPVTVPASYVGGRWCGAVTDDVVAAIGLPRAGAHVSRVPGAYDTSSATGLVVLLQPVGSYVHGSALQRCVRLEGRACVRDADNMQCSLSPLSTSRPLNLSTSQPLNLSTSQPLNLSTARPLHRLPTQYARAAAWRDNCAPRVCICSPSMVQCVCVCVCVCVCMGVCCSAIEVLS